MIFITKEIQQRLLRRPKDSNPTICMAAYPTYDAKMDNPTAKAAYELFLGISKGIRSLIAEYSLKDEAKGTIPLSMLQIVV